MKDTRAQYRNTCYNGYKANHKERAEKDYYSTPTEEVLNILNTMKLDLSNVSILEPCVGGGHMMEGILQYIDTNKITPSEIIASDIQDRGYKNDKINKFIYGIDFLSPEYNQEADYIIMNPPYATIEPFTMKSLGLAKKGLLLLGRLQFLEGEKRFENIFKENPPTDVYVYVDRIACYINGDTSKKMASAQAYAWFYWNFDKIDCGGADTQIHWLRRTDKKD